MGSSGPSSWIRNLSKSPRQVEQHLGVELTQHNRTAVGYQHSSSSMGQQHTEPMLIQQFNGHKQEQLHRYGSGGSTELPSALGTPPKQAAATSNLDEPQPSTQSPTAAAASDSQQQQLGNCIPQESGSEGTSKATKGVRWLPGFKQQGLPPAAPVPGQLTKALPTAVNAAGKQADGSRPSSASDTDRLQGQQQAAPSGNKSSSSSRAGSLPASDDPQLDNYLRYLLHEQHPHKFMYYVGWSLSVEGCAAIGEFLRRDKRIKVMTLSGNGITDEGLELIAEGLAQNGSLLSLDLSDNKISSVGAIELAEALHGNNCKVAELLLANNKIGDDGADALAAAAASSSLKKLKLSGNAVSTAQLDVVEHVLKTREYKWSGQQPSSSSKSSRHMRKVSSGLQFDIELIEGQSRNSSSNNLLARRSILRLSPGVAVAALTEAKDTVESSIGMQAAHLLAELHQKHTSSRQDAVPPTAAQAAQQQDTVSAAAEAAALPAQVAATSASSQPSLAVMLAVRLACRGYDVVLRTCFPSVEGTASGKDMHGQTKQQPAGELVAPGLRHTYLRVSQPMPADETVLLPTVIVDPAFREQFVMPHPSKRLQEALAALPRVLCLAEARLFHLVDLLCTETAAAFKEARLSLPPWRHTAAVMDKWTAPNENYLDVAVDADSSEHQLEQAVQAAAPA